MVEVKCFTLLWHRLFRNLNVKSFLSVWSILNSWYNIAIFDRNYFIPNRSGKPASTRGRMEGFCLGEYLTAYDLQGKNIAGLSAS